MWCPDFTIYRGDIEIGYLEAKDLGLNLRTLKGSNKEQQERYLKALPNLIYTNCFDWEFYRDGTLMASVSIADFQGIIRLKSDRYEILKTYSRTSCVRHRKPLQAHVT